MTDFPASDMPRLARHVKTCFEEVIQAATEGGPYKPKGSVGAALRGGPRQSYTARFPSHTDSHRATAHSSTVQTHAITKIVSPEFR